MSLAFPQHSSLRPEESISQVNFQSDEWEDTYDASPLFESVPPSEVSKPDHGQEQYIKVDEANVKDVNAYLKVILMYNRCQLIFSQRYVTNFYGHLRLMFVPNIGYNIGNVLNGRPGNLKFSASIAPKSERILGAISKARRLE
jgi:hypothetical protein